MRISSYNIQSGGFSGYSTNENHPHRLKYIKEVVDLLGSEVVILIDTHRWVDIFDNKKLKDKFNY